MRIFLGAPFTKHLKKSNGQFHKTKKETIEKIFELLTTLGHDVRNAHVREEFGNKLLDPETCTKLDLEEIKKCDLFVAMPGNPASGGVHVELGWASALNKEILLLLKENSHYSPLVTGLHKVSKAKIIYFKNQADLLDRIKRAFE